MKNKSVIIILITLFILSFITPCAFGRLIRKPSFTIKTTEDNKEIERLSSVINSIFKKEKRSVPKLGILGTEYEAIVARNSITGEIAGGLLYQTELDSILLEEEFYRHEIENIENVLRKKGKELPLPYIDFYVAVKEKYRSQGIGSKLFSKLTEVAKQENWKHFLFLSVREDPGYCNYLNSEVIYKDEAKSRYLILYHVPSNTKNIN